MNILLLILLCVFEAAFAVTAGGRKCDKKGLAGGQAYLQWGTAACFSDNAHCPRN